MNILCLFSDKSFSMNSAVNSKEKVWLVTAQDDLFLIK